MTALASSLKRIWSAKGRVPHQTGWGTPGSHHLAVQRISPASWVHERLLELMEVAQRTAPIVLAITWNIFR
jgi:hypothetical protein